MRILAVDDEQLMLDALTGCIAEAAPDAEICAFRRSREALAFAENNNIDVAFLDIQMRGMNGLELGTRLLELYPSMNLIFCTSYDEFISEAFRKVRCNGYITKPADTAQIKEELSHLRLPVLAIQSGADDTPQSRLYFRCIGRFEAFCDGEPIKFENFRTKELLAYLVHANGGVCGNQELMTVLWDDDGSHDSYFKKLRADLIATFDKLGCSEVLSRQRGGLAINTSCVSCDYYEWKKQHSTEPNEYMLQYEWANPGW